MVVSVPVCVGLGCGKARRMLSIGRIGLVGVKGEPLGWVVSDRRGGGWGGRCAGVGVVSVGVVEEGRRRGSAMKAVIAEEVGWIPGKGVVEETCLCGRGGGMC